MNESLFKQVRVLILYDLPMTETEDRKEYAKFRKDILKLGCYLVQFSVYAKVIKNEVYYKSFIEKLKNILPEKGEVRVIKLTEKQYEDMLFLNGSRNNFEKKISNNNVVVF
jgi:CRISPR-associated protein Cas2